MKVHESAIIMRTSFVPELRIRVFGSELNIFVGPDPVCWKGRVRSKYLDLLLRYFFILWFGIGPDPYRLPSLSDPDPFFSVSLSVWPNIENPGYSMQIANHTRDECFQFSFTSL